MSERKSPDDAFDDLLSDFDEVAGGDARRATPSRGSSDRGRRGGRTYRSALNESQTDRRKAARATGKKASVAGQYLRRSFTFRPDQLENIEQLAGLLGLSQNDLVRWFTDMGIEAVDDGERPPLTEEVRHRYDPEGE